MMIASELNRHASYYTSRVGLVYWFCAVLSSSAFGKNPFAELVANCPNASASITSANSETCCYALQLHYEQGGTYTAVETALVSPGVEFSAINYNIGGGWYYYHTAPQRLIWERVSGALPLGDTQLFNFCISNYNSTEPAQIVVTWMVNHVRICSDTLDLPCYRCLSIDSEGITCLEDSNSVYNFQFTNYSEFPVNSLRITESVGMDHIVETSISLVPPLPPGSSRSLSLTLRNSAETQELICFEATSSQQLDNGSNIICCTSSHCFEAPECDRCCTSYEQFEDDVAAGFDIISNCESDSLSIIGNGLSSCDHVQWQLANLSAGTTIGGSTPGDIAIVFSFLGNTPYELCMTVRRHDFSGMSCYQEATLSYCEPLFFDCPCVDSSHINWNYECPAVIELVCGCDGMTYLNDCAALNWSGVESWTTGECHDPPAGVISLNVSPQGSQALLEWITSQGLSYRFFIVQRRLMNGDWTTLGVVSGFTFSFLDIAPGMGLNQYRIVGVTYPGKPVFSNIDNFLITSTEDSAASSLWQIWPNPVHDNLWLAAAYEGEFELSTYSIDGHVIHTQVHYFKQNTNTSLDVSTLPTGMYLLRLQHPDGRTMIRRFVKL